MDCGIGFALRLSITMFPWLHDYNDDEKEKGRRGGLCLTQIIPDGTI